MNESNQSPLTAQEPPKDLTKTESIYVKINGRNVSVKDYRANPEKYNTKPIPQSYLNSVCKELSTKTKEEFNLELPLILTKNKEKSQ